MTVLLQQTEFPLRTVYDIEQLKVILKSRVWDAEESMAILTSQPTELSTDIHGIFKTEILKGRQCRRRSHRIQPRFDTRVKQSGNLTKAGGKGYTRLL
jgi:hypothetical protein